MSQNNAVVDLSIHKKMYKSGKQWVVGAIATAAVLGFSTVATSQTAHADTTNGNVSTNTTTSTSGTAFNVSTDTGSVTSAASAASNAGANIASTSGSTYNTSTAEQLSSAKAAVSSHYASETAALSSVQQQAENSNSVSNFVTSANAQADAQASNAKAQGYNVNRGSEVTVGSNGKTIAEIQSDITSQQNALSNKLANNSSAIASTNALSDAAAIQAQSAQAMASSLSASGVKVNSANSVIANSAQLASVMSANSSNFAAAVATVESNNAVKSATASADSDIAALINSAKSAGITINSSTKSVATASEAEAMISSAKAALDSAVAKANSSTQDSVANAQYTNGQYTSYDSTNVLYKTADLGGKVGVILNGPNEGGDNYGQYSVTVTGVDKAHIVTSVKVTSLEFPWGGNDGEVSGDSSLIPAYDYANAGAVKIYAVENGTWAFAPDAVHLADGSTTGLWIRFNGAGAAMNTNQKIAVYYTADGDIDSLVGGTEGHNDITNTMTYQIANKALTNMSEKYITAFWQNDIDMGQKASIGAGNGVNTQGSSTTSTSAVNLVLGGGMTNGISKFVNDNNGNIFAKAADNLGYDPATGKPTGKNATVASALNGVNSLPDGGVLSLIYGNHFNVSVQNSTSAGAWGVAQGMFGNTTNVKIDTVSTDVVLPTFTPSEVSTTITTPQVRKSNVNINIPTYKSGVETPSGIFSLDHITYTNGNVSKTESEKQNGISVDVNGKTMVNGDTGTYQIQPESLPAGRTSEVTKVAFHDVIPNGIDINSASITYNGQDITSKFTLTKNGNSYDFVSTDASLLNELNFDMTSSTVMPVLTFNYTLNTNDFDVKSNTAQVVITTKSGVETIPSNTVTTKKVKETPTKSQSVNGRSSTADNGTTVQRGDSMNYDLVLDYTNFTNTAVSDTARAKAWGSSDALDKNLTYEAGSAYLVDQSGNKIDASKYTVTYNSSTRMLTVQWKSFSDAEAYFGTKVHVKFNADVNEDVKKGTVISNQHYQMDGVNNITDLTEGTPSNVVTVTVEDPKTPVKTANVNGTTDAKSDGSTVVQANDAVNYTVTLDYTDYQTGDTVGKISQSLFWGASDPLDANTTYESGSAYLVDQSGNKIDSSKYTVTYDSASKTISVKWNSFDDIKSYLGTKVSLKFQVKVNEGVAADTKINNQAYQMNGTAGWNVYTSPNSTPTNKTTVVTKDPTPPTKSETVDENTADGNGKEVVHGNTIHYTVNLDYSHYTTDSKVAKSAQSEFWGVSDPIDSNLTYVDGSAKLVDSEGKDIDASLYTANYNKSNRILGIQWKDYASLQKYFGTKVSLKFDATVNDDVKGGTEIDNQAYQMNGTTGADDLTDGTPTNKVHNKTYELTPTKGVTDKTSTTDISFDNDLDGKSIQIGQEDAYTLAWGSIPSDYAGTVSSFSAVDDYDQSHDKILSTKTVSRGDITLKDGTIIKAGTDLSQYLDVKDDGSVLTFNFKSDFLNKIDFTKSNFDIISKVNFKRIAYGTVTNVFTTYLNGKPYRSTTVTTKTPEPQKPTTPATPAQPGQKGVVTPAQPTPATPAQPSQKGAAQQTLPQTGNESGEAMLLAGLAMVTGATALGLGLRRKKQEN